MFNLREPVTQSLRLHPENHIRPQLVGCVSEIGDHHRAITQAIDLTLLDIRRMLENPIYHACDSTFN